MAVKTITLPYQGNNSEEIILFILYTDIYFFLDLLCFRLLYSALIFEFEILNSENLLRSLETSSGEYAK